MIVESVFSNLKAYNEHRGNDWVKAFVLIVVFQ